MSATEATPPDAMTWPRPSPTRRSEQVEVRSRQPAVPIDGGRFEGRDALVRERRQGVLRSNAGGSGTPALPERESVANIDGHGDPLGSVGRDEAAGEGWIAQRGGPDHGSRGSCGERGVDQGFRPETTGHLDGDSVADRLDDLAR